MPYLFVQLTVAGSDTGPFNLYSNSDGFISAFESNISKSSLLSGITVDAPVGTIMIRITSANTVCSNYVDIPVAAYTTSTSTLSTSSTSTSTTTLLITTSTTSTTEEPITTTTTTTEGCSDGFSYNVSFYSCEDCENTGSGTICNEYPLTINKWYYDPFTGNIIRIDSFVECTCDFSNYHILDETKRNECNEILCPTTTSTTTIEPTTSTTSTTSEIGPTTTTTTTVVACDTCEFEIF